MVRDKEIRVVVLCPTTDGDKAEETLDCIARTTDVPFEARWSEDKLELGFTKNVNALLRLLWSDKDLQEVPYAVIINDDVRILESGWLERMIEVMDTSPQFGMASPSGFCHTQPICYGKAGMKLGVQYVRQLPMFATIMRVEMVKELGLLNEGFVHYGSDSDLCQRACQAGWRLLWIRDVFVVNQPSEIREDWKKHDGDLFRKIWGWGG